MIANVCDGYVFHLLFSGFDQSEGGNSGLQGKPKEPDPSKVNGLIVLTYLESYL